MKPTQLLIGILIGAILGFGLTKYFSNPEKSTSTVKIPKADSSAMSLKWKWSESLDALKAAPDNHKVVYEDKNVRVLAVMLDAKKSEPVHTHQWKSIMWIAKPIVPCKINQYKKDQNGILVKSDSVIIKEMPTDIGQLIEPEGPTSITNLGIGNGLAYRVEFKKHFQK